MTLSRLQKSRSMKDKTLVGQPNDQAVLRFMLLTCVMMILGLAVFLGLPPSVEEADNHLGRYRSGTTQSSVSKSPRSLSVLSSSRLLFNASECTDRDPEICPEEDSCLVDEVFEFACCIREDEQNEATNDFSLSRECTTKEGQSCPAKDLCVAELIPGSGVGAECLFEFELQGDGAAGAIFHFFLMFYLFLALAIIVNDYFEFSLDKLADLFGMTPDVKGATFAAIGSSAPELFVSLADNVISNPPKSVGVGTIVGSAIFNILVIIGASGVAAGYYHGDMVLDKRPLARDSLFYIFSILGLFVVTLDEEARLEEGIVLVLVYVLYICFMFFNKSITTGNSPLGTCGGFCADPPGSDAPNENMTEEVNENVRRPSAKSDFAGQVGKGEIGNDNDDEPDSYFSVLYDWPVLPKAPKAPVSKTSAYSILIVWLKRFYFILVWPINFLYRITVPDMRYDLFGTGERGKNFGYWLEFIMCIVHIAIVSHLLVYSAAKFGCLVGISPAVMGLTFLAAGTSVPDMLTSIALTKNDQGDAAVANSIGSNVFDILIGLGLPWFLAEIVYGVPSRVEADDINVGMGFLTGVLIILIVALKITNWHLTRNFGLFLLILYVFYVIFELALNPVRE